YIAMWNETGDAERRSIIAATWTDDGTYLDHLMSRDGPAAIDEMVAGAQQKSPGARFELTAGPDHHHDRVRFAWRMTGGEGGAELARRVDFATVGDHGRPRH